MFSIIYLKKSQIIVLKSLTFVTLIIILRVREGISYLAIKNSTNIIDINNYYIYRFLE